MFNSTEVLGVGGNPAAGGGTAGGSIDELRFWNIARTQTEIQNNSNIKLNGNESGLVAYYPFDEGIGNATVDQSIGTNHGSNTGTTQWIVSNIDAPINPSNLVTTEVSSTQIDLSWNDNSSDETDFAIFRSTGNNSSFSEIGTVGGANITTYSDNTVTADNNYFYQVVARNANGDSDQSNEKAGATFTHPGNALSFDGTDDYIEIPDGPDFDIGTTFTFETWVYLNSYNANGIFLFNKWQDAAEDKFVSVNADGTIRLNLFNGAIDLTSTGTLPLSQWAHVAATYESGVNASIYINGIEDINAAAFSDPADGTGDVYLGRNPDRDTFEGVTRILDGQLDEVRFWNTARTEAQIQSTLSSELVGNEAGLMAYYKFDQTDPAITTLPDRSANNNNGVLNGFGGLANWNVSGALGVPIQPDSLFVTEVSPTQIDLSWNDNSSDETDFAIFRSTGNNSSFSEIATVGGADITTYSDNTVTADNNYFYYVVARNTNGDSAPSNERAAATFAHPGNALAFDGVDDFISLVENPLGPGYSGNFTVEAWINPNLLNRNPTYGAGVIRNTNDETIGDFYLSVLEDGRVAFGYWDVSGDDPDGQNLSVSSVPDGTWTHIAASYDGATARIFINGIEESITTNNTATGWGVSF